MLESPTRPFLILILLAPPQLHEDDEILTVWSVDESDFTTYWTALSQV
jgi:hypothetical protein